MFINYMTILFVININVVCSVDLFWSNSSLYSRNATICCMRDEWEGLFFMNQGSFFILHGVEVAFSLNGTVNVAYSFARKKIYLDVRAIEQYPGSDARKVTMTILYDYNTLTSYTVQDGDCEKDIIYHNMGRQCVPLTATLLSTATFGDEERPIETYQYSVSSDDDPATITAVLYKNDLTPVEPQECGPMSVTYFRPLDTGTGYFYNIHVMDMHPIKKADIFDIPEACK